MSKSNETYNGWSNWDTWNVNLHLTSNHKYYMDTKNQSGYFIEKYYRLQVINHDDLSVNNVNWEEISEGMKT